MLEIPQNKKTLDCSVLDIEKSLPNFLFSFKWNFYFRLEMFCTSFTLFNFILLALFPFQMELLVRVPRLYVIAPTRRDRRGRRVGAITFWPLLSLVTYSELSGLSQRWSTV